MKRLPQLGLWFVTIAVMGHAPFLPAAEQIRHSFFVAGPTFTGILGEDGSPLWDAGRAGARDGYVLDNGNVLIAWNNMVREISRERAIIFEYKISPSNKEIGTAVRLKNGNTLITELGNLPRLLEVNAAGAIAVECPLIPETDNAHMQTRMARKLKNGNYLVPHLLAFKVKEYNAAGLVQHELRTDLDELGGRPAENWPFTAIRLSNGNTLVNLTHGNQVVELAHNNRVVWRVSNDDLPGTPFVDPCGCQRLPNGNTVIASYGAQQGTKLFEITRDKQMVWSYSGPHRVHHFQILTTNGERLLGDPLK